MSDQGYSDKKKMTFKEKLIEAFSIHPDFTHRFFYIVCLSGIFGATNIINLWFRDWIANPDKILQLYLVYVLARLAVAPVLMMFYKFFHKFKNLFVIIITEKKYLFGGVERKTDIVNEGIWGGFTRVLAFFAFNIIFTLTLYKAWVEPRHTEEYIFFGVIYFFSFVIPIVINYVLVIKLIFYIPGYFKGLKEKNRKLPLIGFPIVMIIFLAAYYFIVFN